MADEKEKPPAKAEKPAATAENGLNVYVQKRLAAERKAKP